MSTHDALEVIAKAASSIVDERRRLNETFEHLRRAVSTLDPSKYLTDEAVVVSAPDGYLGTVPPPTAFIEADVPPVPPAPPVIAEEQARTRVRAWLNNHGPQTGDQLLDQLDMPSYAISKALVQLVSHGEVIKVDDRYGVPDDPAFQKTAEQERNDSIAIWLLNHGVKHYNAVKKEFPQWNVRAALTQLVEEGIVKRDSAGLYFHRDYVAPAPKPDAGATKGSGKAQDVSPGGRRPPTATQASPSTSETSPTSGSVSGSEIEATQPSSTYGLARSPKPRDEMKPHQRKAEETLDAFVAWAQDQGDTFDALTARRELGVNQTGYKDYKSDGLFGNDAMPTDYARILVERGVFERTGRSIHPWWKKNVKSMGRTTPEYRMASTTATTKEPQSSSTSAATEVKPGPKAPTLEQVRDAAVELKQMSMAELILKLGLPNTNKTRHLVRDHMSTLVNRKMFKDMNEEGVTGYRYEYIPPPKESEAARIQRQTHQVRVSERAKAEINRVAQISGTGKKKKSTNSRVNQVLDACRKIVGLDNVKPTPGGHWHIHNPENGKSVRISATPSGERTILNDLARLRRAGVKVMV